MVAAHLVYVAFVCNAFCDLSDALCLLHVVYVEFFLQLTRFPSKVSCLRVGVDEPRIDLRPSCLCWNNLCMILGDCFGVR